MSQEGPPAREENPFRQKTEQEAIFEEIESYRKNLAASRAALIEGEADVDLQEQQAQAMSDLVERMAKEYSHITDPNYKEIIDSRIETARASVLHFMETSKNVRVAAKAHQEALDELEDVCEELAEEWKKTLY